MGKDSSESEFGFKNKEKAEETLRALKSHELQYQKLTVRGLLTRAKRTLSLTKAPDKIENITAAMEVFKIWLDENDTSSSNKKPKSESKEDSSDKAQTVPGLGFKDAEAAKKTLEILKDRDLEYQKLAIKGLLGSANRVLPGTKNESKISAIKEAIDLLNSYLSDITSNKISTYSFAYLPVETVMKFADPKDKLQSEFRSVYCSKKNYKYLRTLFPSSDEKTSWDIVRNRHLGKLLAKLGDKELFNKSGEPTDEHLSLIHWAYSPQLEKLKQFVEGGSKRKSDTAESSSSSKKRK